MKKLFKSLETMQRIAVVAFAAVMLFAFAGCRDPAGDGTIDDPSGDSSNTEPGTDPVDPVVPVISITTQPAANTHVTEGNISGSLTVAASVTENAALMYRWFSNGTNSNVGGTSINGANSANFPIPQTLTVGTYYYFCEVSAENAVSVRSNVAVVNVTKQIDSIAVTSDPDNMSFTHGDILDTEALDGLIVTITYAGGSDEDVEPEDFASYGLSTVPAIGTVLRYDADYNGEKIKVIYEAGVDIEDETGNGLTIGKKDVTITGVSASNKTYDGTTTATITGTAVVSGKLAADTVTVTNGTAAFADANVANGITVTFTGFSLDGDNADCYTLSAQPESVTANITQATGATVTKPEISAVTHTSITASATKNNDSVGTNTQTVEYRLLSGTTGETVAKVWQDTGTFTGLTAGTTYRVQARTKDSTNHMAGAINTSDPDNTYHATGITISMGSFTVTDAAAGKGIFDQTVTIGTGETNTIDAGALTVTAWHLGNADITALANSGILTLSRGMFSTAGNYTVTVTFTEDGKSWLGSIAVQVTGNN